MNYYLFCHKFGNFPLRAIYLPLDLLPSDIKDDFDYMFNKYGEHYNIVEDKDAVISRLFELLADGSPSNYDILFNINTFDYMEMEIPNYFNNSIIYYDNENNRKKFGVDIMITDNDSIYELYNILKTKYNVIRSILYDE